MDSAAEKLGNLLYPFSGQLQDQIFTDSAAEILGNLLYPFSGQLQNQIFTDSAAEKLGNLLYPFSGQLQDQIFADSAAEKLGNLLYPFSGQLQDQIFTDSAAEKTRVNYCTRSLVYYWTNFFIPAGGTAGKARSFTGPFFLSYSLWGAPQGKPDLSLDLSFFLIPCGGHRRESQIFHWTFLSFLFPVGGTTGKASMYWTRVEPNILS
jgi:hypothetical protein